MPCGTAGPAQRRATLKKEDAVTGTDAFFLVFRS